MTAKLLKQLREDLEIFNKICREVDRQHPVNKPRPQKLDALYWLAANRYQALAEIILPIEEALGKMK